MTKMSKAQQTAILAREEIQEHRGIVVVRDRRTMEGIVQQGWALPADNPQAGYVTRAGLIAAGVDMDAIHAEALVEDKSIVHHPAFARAQEIGAAERQRAAARAGVDNRDEIGAPRTQRFHSLFKTTRSWPAALDILHAEALAADLHATGQRNALGTIIGCECDQCAEVIHMIKSDNFGHKVQGV